MMSLKLSDIEACASHWKHWSPNPKVEVHTLPTELSLFSCETQDF